MRGILVFSKQRQSDFSMHRLGGTIILVFRKRVIIIIIFSLLYSNRQHHTFLDCISHATQSASKESVTQRKQNLVITGTT